MHPSAAKVFNWKKMVRVLEVVMEFVCVEGRRKFNEVAHRKSKDQLLLPRHEGNSHNGRNACKSVSLQFFRESLSLGTKGPVRRNENLNKRRRRQDCPDKGDTFLWPEPREGGKSNWIFACDIVNSKGNIYALLFPSKCIVQISREEYHSGHWVDLKYQRHTGIPRVCHPHLGDWSVQEEKFY